jgi:small-conductance mechanosensitive channel
MKENIEQFILPVSILFTFLIIGFIFDKILFRYFKKIAEKTKWEGDDIFLKHLHNKSILWSFLVGLYISTLNINLTPTLSGHLKKLIIIIFILSITWVAMRIAVDFVNLYTKKKEGTLPTASIFRNITKVTIFIIGLLIILQTLGISITPLITALGVGGLAVALALQDTLSNLFAGLQILASKQIRVGDYIKLTTSEEGTITDITWRNTTVKQLSNNCVIIPNSKIATSILTNFDLPDKELSVPVMVCINYDNNLKQVEEIALKIAKDVMKEFQKDIQNFEPAVRFHTFADNNIRFTIGLRAKEYVDQYLLTHEVLKRIHEEFKKKGIKIIPVQQVSMNN